MHQGDVTEEMLTTGFTTALAPPNCIFSKIPGAGDAAGRRDVSRVRRRETEGLGWEFRSWLHPGSQREG